MRPARSSTTSKSERLGSSRLTLNPRISAILSFANTVPPCGIEQPDAFSCRLDDATERASLLAKVSRNCNMSRAVARMRPRLRRRLTSSRLKPSRPERANSSRRARRLVPARRQTCKGRRRESRSCPPSCAASSINPAGSGPSARKPTEATISRRERARRLRTRSTPRCARPRLVAPPLGRRRTQRGQHLGELLNGPSLGC